MTWLMGLVVVVLAVLAPHVASAVDCAFEDNNDDQVFNAGDVLVPDAAWIGGAAFVTASPFVVPVGCDKVLVSGLAITNGVRVTAAKISFFGRLEYLPAGGRGVVFISLGDLQVGDGINPAVIKAGGVNTLALTEIAIARKSIALAGAGECHFRFADIRGVAPIQNTQIGIRCGGDMSFRSSSVIGSRVNIQSLTGKIDAGNGSGGGGVLLSLAALCDDPVTNLTGNGDGDGVISAGDFPCSLNLGGVVNFADAPSLQAACTPFAFTPGNRFHAFNDPMIMIAGAGGSLNVLDVQGASIVGRYRVTLAAEDGAVLTQTAIIDHGEQLGLTPPGGARIWVFADPASVVRLPVDREDFFGPSSASTFIQDACYRSPNAVNVGRDAALAINLVGTPLPAPCKQNNGVDFVGVLNGIF